MFTNTVFVFRSSPGGICGREDGASGFGGRRRRRQRGVPAHRVPPVPQGLPWLPGAAGPRGGGAPAPDARPRQPRVHAVQRHLRPSRPAGEARASALPQRDRGKFNRRSRRYNFHFFREIANIYALIIYFSLTTTFDRFFNYLCAENRLQQL